MVKDGHLEGCAHILDLPGQLRVFERRNLPIVHFVPPPANPAPECLSAERGIAIPEAPA